MELILMVFLKKFSFRENGPFWPKNGISSQLWNHTEDSFEILRNERAKLYMEIS